MEKKICQNCKQDFTIDSVDLSFYENIKVPKPTFCVECRIKMRLASLNHRGLFLSVCSKCGKEIPSMYEKNTLFVVYCTECYFSDEWDASTYKQEYDPSKNFFVQFYELIKKVPQLHIEHTNNNTGDIVFSNYVYRSKSIYLSYGVVRSENVFYSWGSHNRNKNCFDCMDFSDNELCYELVDANKNYACQYLNRSHNCLDCQYLFDCSNCSNCFMSSNLRNKSYVFKNIKYSKEKYFSLLNNVLLNNFEVRKKLEGEYDSLIKRALHRYAILYNNTLTCTGDEISNSKNIKCSFSIQKAEDSSYIQITTNVITNCMDMSMSGRAEFCYQMSVCGRGNYNSLFSYNVGDTRDILYCDGCNHVKNCFGCVGLKHKEFCILNKQYSSEEYHRLVELIRKEMTQNPYIDRVGRKYSFGDYFPFDFSRFAYNQSMAYEMFPQAESEIKKQGLSWLQLNKGNHLHDCEFRDVEQNLENNYQRIINCKFPCDNKGETHLCTKSFKITKSELDYYIKYNLPLPRKCPNCRYFERKNKKLPWKLWYRSCMCDNKNHGHTGKCEIEFETSYSIERPEKIFCEKCYQKEVY